MVNNKPTLVWIAWKDALNPQAGGAEVVHHEISKRLLSEYAITHLVPGWPGCLAEEWVDGIRILRCGQSVSAFARLAYRYRKELRDNTNVLIDSFNCFGSLAYLVAKKETRKIVFIHHIQGPIWFYECVKPFRPPVNLLGWLAEKLELGFIARTLRGRVITVSASTQAELRRLGFRDVSVLSEGASFAPQADLPALQSKEAAFTVLFFGGMRRMKRPLHALRAFCIFHAKHPESRLWMFGAGQENDRVQLEAERHGIADAVTLFGRVSEQQKIDLVRRAHVLLQTSVKEGWGIAVSEAAVLGTPAITYDVPGLRDSNRYSVICKANTPTAMAEELEKLYADEHYYQSVRQDTWRFSQTLSFDKSTDQLRTILGSVFI